MFRRPLSLATIRGLSTATSHAPPKKTHGTLGRYAGSLFTAASKAGQLTKVQEELLAFNKAVSTSPAFTLFLKNPTISRGEKANVMAGLFDNKFSDITKNLFITLAANGRIANADKVIAEFLDLMETASGVVKAVVISAEPIQGKTLKSVQSAVLDMVEKGKKVHTLGLQF